MKVALNWMKNNNQIWIMSGYPRKVSAEFATEFNFAI